MGLVLSITLITMAVSLAIQGVNDAKDRKIAKGRKDVEKRMQDLNAKTTELRSLVDTQKQKIKENADKINTLESELNNTYHTINDINYAVVKEFKDLDATLRDTEKDLGIALDKINDSQFRIISQLDALKSAIKQEMRNMDAEDIISPLNLILTDFYSQIKQFNKYPVEERISELEKPNGILQYMDDSRVPKQGTLYYYLSYMIKRKFVIPQSKDDKFSLKMLELLCNGVDVYAYMLGFLLQQYTFLGHTYYRKNNVEKYNHYYIEGVNTFIDFSNTLTGGIGLIDKTIQVLYSVGKLDFIQGNRKDVIEMISANIAKFRSTQISLDKNRKLFQFEIPGNLNSNLDFSPSNISIPISDWKSGTKVSYAIHLQGNDTVPFAMISPWSTGYNLDKLANPAVPIYRDHLGRTRVIFRKIGNGTPQIVATVQDDAQRVFRDIDRDLFNAACELNQQISLKNVRIYIENKANVNAVFEQNKRAIHAAARNNNWKVAHELVKNGAEINAVDEDGYSPIYIASELGHEEFVEELIKLNVDVNIQLSDRKHRLTPLHSAVYKGHVGIVNKLLSVPSIHINAQTTDGFTPFHFATYYNNEKIISLLFNHNRLDIDAKSTEIEIPLCLSTDGTFDKEAHFLINSGNVSPLQLSSAFGSKAVLNNMLHKSKGIKTRTNDGSIALHFAALNRDESIVSSFKHLSLEDVVDTQNDREFTALYYAYYSGNNDTANRLIDEHCANKDIRLQNNKSLLHFAAIYGHTTAASHLINPTSVDDTDALGRTPLHYAVWLGNIEMVNLLLENDANSNAVDHEGIPISHMTINLMEEKASVIIKQLIDNNLDVNAKGPSNRTLLHLFCAIEYPSVVEFLLENSADVNAVCCTETLTSDTTPLLISSTLGNLDIVKILGNHNAIISENDPLFNAVTGNGTLDMVKYFDKKYPIKCSDYELYLMFSIRNFKNDIFMYYAKKITFDSRIKDEIYMSATTFGNVFVLKYLFEDIDYSPENVICGILIGMYFSPTSSTGIDLIKYMIDIQKAKLNTDDAKCASILWWALWNELTEKQKVVEYLIERGVEGNVKIVGTNELHLASKYGLNKVVNHLLNKGYREKINNKDSDNMTSLVLAVTGDGNLDLVKMLIQAGAHFDSYNNNTLINIAAQTNKTDVAEHLINTGVIDPALADTNGVTPLHWAATNNNQDLTEKLLSTGKVDINAESNLKTTPIYEAIKNFGDYNVMDVLVKNHARINHFDLEKCENLVSLAIDKKKFKIAKSLIVKHNADITTPGLSDRTPLYAAIDADNPELVKILLDRGADYNFLGKNKKTPTDLLLENKSNTIMFFAYDYRNKHSQTMLHLMASLNKDKVVQTLLERGAYVNVQDKDGNSPLHLAAKNGQLDAVKMMCEMKKKCINVALKNVNKQTALDLAKLNNQTEVVKYLEKQNPGQRTRREIVEQFSDPPASSSAGKVSWWVSDFVGSVVNTLGSITTQASQSMLSSSYYKSHTAPQSISSLSASVNVHSTLLLLDVLARKFTGQSYVGTDSQTSSPLNARSNSLVIVEQFERMLNRLANETNSQFSSELDSFELYRSVEHCLLSGEYSKIECILLSTARDAFPSDFVDESLLVMSVEELLVEILFDKKDSSLVETSSVI